MTPQCTAPDDSWLQCVEVPLIEHGSGPDRARLPEALRQPWDWVLLTSPEAAAVFLEVCSLLRASALGT